MADKYTRASTNPHTGDAMQTKSDAGGAEFNVRWEQTFGKTKHQLRLEAELKQGKEDGDLLRKLGVSDVSGT